MTYYVLKMLHIVCAGLLLSGIVSSVYLWFTNKDTSHFPPKINLITATVIIPFALMQLFTGFSIISLMHYNMSDTWVIGSTTGFFLVMMSWFGFLYFTSHRRLQNILLILCLASILTMVYFMTNKIT